MKDSIKRIMTAGILVGIVSSLAPSAVLAYDRDQQAINRLLQQGIINPGQAAALSNRSYNGFNGFNGVNGMGFNSFPGPANGVYYTTPEIQRLARDIDKMNREGQISLPQLNVMKAQLTAHINAVNSNAGNPMGYAAQTAMPVSPYHMVGYQNPWHPNANQMMYGNGCNGNSFNANGFSPNGFNPNAFNGNGYGNVYGSVVNSGLGAQVRNFMNF